MPSLRMLVAFVFITEVIIRRLGQFFNIYFLIDCLRLAFQLPTINGFASLSPVWKWLQGRRLGGLFFFDRCHRLAFGFDFRDQSRQFCFPHRAYQ